MGIEASFEFIAYTVPAIIALGGILLLFLGYSTSIGNMIGAGWGLVVLGAFIYLIELAVAYYSSQY